jgi:phosphoglycolate phosphatase
VPADGELLRYIGPAIAGSFATLLGTNEASSIERAIAAYRDRYATVGILESSVYPGVPRALAELAGLGHRMIVVTAKPRVYAERVLVHFGLAPHFECVYGPELGDRQYTKGTLLRAACAASRIQPKTAVMIGDRFEDIAGAAENRLPAIAVAWGYGTREELEAARPSYIASSVGELMTHLRGAGTGSLG